MSGEILNGVVRPGPPPADADRPQVVICDEHGTPVQAVVHLPDGTVAQINVADLDPGPIFTQPERRFHLDSRMGQSFGGHLFNPRDSIRITGI